MFGNLAWISLILSIASVSPVGGFENLYAPWLVPIAIASASTFVWSTNFEASSGSVRSWSCDKIPSAPTPSSFSPVPVSSDPRQPISPSTETLFWVIWKKPDQNLPVGRFEG